MRNTTLADELGYAAASLADATRNLLSPGIRLGITGLSGAGKTVFITALVHNLLNGASLPLFEPVRAGHVRDVHLEPQPDVHVPRFAYEEHLRVLTAGEERHWPESTRQLSQLRLTLRHDAIHGMLPWSDRTRTLHIDIVDYPGEWLPDLPLLNLGYDEWSDRQLEKLAALAAEEGKTDPYLQGITGKDAAVPWQEEDALAIVSAYQQRLHALKEKGGHYDLLQPGRFLMPGDLANSPMLTFAPLPTPEAGFSRNSLYREMKRRYEAYVRRVVRPFFFEHFARMDVQVVLVDVLSAINAGPRAILELQAALTHILECFRIGPTRLLARRVERILFAATRADLVHHTQHERLRRILAWLVENAARKAGHAGARITTLALAAIRATREGEMMHAGEPLPVIIGVPEAGERLGDQIFDGRTETAVFPGDLPENPEDLLQDETRPSLQFPRFRPPLIARPVPLEPAPSFPFIRLDEALQFLLGDRLS